jgi:hypothetical protein
MLLNQTEEQEIPKGKSITQERRQYYVYAC